MSELINCRATFLHYLADNLTDLTVHNIRFDKSNPQFNEPLVNAVNVTFHNLDLTGPSSPDEQLVTVDVMYDTEPAAVAAAEEVANLLFTAAYAPLLNYMTSPVIQIGNKRVYWRLSMKFTQVHAVNYFRMSALMHLCFT